jgi:hypothetical protein
VKQQENVTMRNDTAVADRPTRRKRQRGERGIAMVMVGLLIVPMLVFAAFGVDLASWYARISAIQRAADAAALAGAVWMPHETTACIQADASLRSNGMHNSVDSNISHTCEQGSTATSLRVTVTDARADRFFSGIFIQGDQRLTRHAEAEYNLPLPLGSPLNYFGGDASATQPPQDINWHVEWPSYYNTRAPQVNGTCNISTDSAHELGQWTGTPPAYNASGYTGSSPACSWGVGRTNASGTATTPPPDYTTRAPNNPTCRVRSSSATHGYWLSGPVRFATSGSSTTNNCVWDNSTTDMSLLAGHPLGNVSGGRPSATPVQRPCRVGYAQSDGWYATSTSNWTNSGTPPTGMFTGGSVGQGNRLCTWSARTYFTDDTPANPIEADRNPGFWAMIYGPGQYAANGDAFSTQCTRQFNCNSAAPTNLEYRTDDNRGEWYVVEIPAGVTGNVAIRVFDAAFNPDFTPDFDEPDAGSNPRFTTEYIVHDWGTSTDFNDRTQLNTTSSTDASDGECYWAIEDEPDFHETWATLCNINVSGPSRYLVNVRTNRIAGANNAAANNGYAIEAVLDGDRDATPGPSIFAYRDMVIANNNTDCSGGTCVGSFYLAKVDETYAGRTLVLELYDAGDSTNFLTTTVWPMMPSESAPRPVVNVSASDCTYTATPRDNDLLTGLDARRNSGTRTNVTTPTAPDSGDGYCGVRATINRVRQYNGLWLTIRVQIPSDYECDRDINTPEETAGSCWWGVRYQMSGSPNGPAGDTTTWSARIEGNPLQLTE